jgi:glucokinase
MRRHLGLDLGGSAIKSVVLERRDDTYERVHVGVTPTEAAAEPSRIVDQLGEVGAKVADLIGGVDTAGITIPGLFDHETGVAAFVTNLGGDAWDGTPVRDPVATALGVPTALINDARAFGFGEARLGAARGCDTAAFFTLGTGVGGAVVVGGRLQLGLGNAGELGHLTVDPDPEAPVCGCGNPGCLEAHARAATIARLGGRSTSEEVVEAARAGDEEARSALEQIGRWLGVGMANVIVTLNPERIVVGGGVAEAGDLLLEPARLEVRRRVRVAPVERIAIVTAELGYEAGSIGAAVWGAEEA